MEECGTVRSHMIKDGHLFLSLMADGGIYEFEPMSSGGIKAARFVLTIAGAVVATMALVALRRSRST